MTPSAEPTSQRADIAALLVPADLLSGGEIIILAIKPSGWFVLLASLPWLVPAGIVVALAYVADIYRSGTPVETIGFICAVGVLGRVTAACWQWMGRTYVLTDRRIVTVRGLIHVRVTAAALCDVRRAVLAAGVAERLVGVASIYCITDSQTTSAVAWNTIAKPDEVHEIVTKTIERAN